jgi:hypothetical protein
MAKTDWRMGDTVLPEDLNQIGQEINSAQEKADSALPASQYTAADILEKIKTVDGAGSGLDADMLDGLQASDFSTAVNAGYNEDPNTTEKAYILTNHSNSPIGGSFWHIRTFFYLTRTGNRSQLAISYSNSNKAFIRYCNNGTWSPWTELITKELAERFIYGDNNRATIEYTGNLDNIEKSGFYYAATGHTNSPTSTNGQLIHVQRGSSASQALQIFQPFNSDAVYFRKKNSTWANWIKLSFFEYGTNKLRAEGEYAGVRARSSAGTAAEFDGYINGVRRGLLRVDETQVDLRKYASNGSTIEKRLTLTNSDATIDGNTIWHAGNDGAGSGLDADLLDGIQSTRFIYGDNQRGTIQYTGNLNNITKSGFYYAHSGHSNGPTGENGHLIHCQMASDDGYALQIFTTYSNDRMFIRRKNNGTWTSWTELYNTSNLSSDRTRKITISQSAPSGGSDGDIWFQY